MKKVLFFLVFIALVYGDIFLHNPRGSNNRNSEANSDRNSANRLFNSQNNARGGYCKGGLLSKIRKIILRACDELL